jgi:hypothetical protein
MISMAGEHVVAEPAIFTGRAQYGQAIFPPCRMRGSAARGGLLAFAVGLIELRLKRGTRGA